VGLYVSTTGTDVPIPELGITLTDPTVDRQLDAQFSAEDIKGAVSLTSAITSGALVWKKTAGGAIEVPSDYDADFLEVQQDATGTGNANDQVLTKAYIRSGRALASDFSGSPKKATITLPFSFPNTNYSVSFSGVDSRVFTYESLTTTTFVINANANLPLTGDVKWIAQLN